MIVTFISDTHNKHNQITEDLPGGDLLIHSGDISSMGYHHELKAFYEWFDNIPNYTTKVFIAGNHDWGFLDARRYIFHKEAHIPQRTQELIDSYPHIPYLQDQPLQVQVQDQTVNLYGSPWQPEFFNWAFNLPRNGEGLREKWANIPSDTDILITHGPAYGYLDKVIGRTDNLGCELLADRIKEISPKIHVCGHIHSGYGYTYDGNTHYVNASILDEGYNFTNRPLTINWNPATNDVEFL
jgi:hypothetical protein